MKTVNYRSKCIRVLFWPGWGSLVHLLYKLLHFFSVWAGRSYGTRPKWSFLNWCKQLNFSIRKKIYRFFSDMKLAFAVPFQQFCNHNQKWNKLFLVFTLHWKSKLYYCDIIFINLNTYAQKNVWKFSKIIQLFFQQSIASTP